MKNEKMQVKFYFYCSIFNQIDVSNSNEQQSGQTRVASAETLEKEKIVFRKEGKEGGNFR